VSYDEEPSIVGNLVGCVVALAIMVVAGFVLSKLGCDLGPSGPLPPPSTESTYQGDPPSLESPLKPIRQEPIRKD